MVIGRQEERVPLAGTNRGPATVGSSQEEAEDVFRSLSASCSEFQRLHERCPRLSDAEAFHGTVSAMHRLCERIVIAERQGLDQKRIRDLIVDARDIHALSHFVRRLQIWPRGYMGDFETIEQIVCQENRTEPSSIGFWIEEYALSSGIAQQHRNKVMAQAALLREVVAGADASSFSPVGASRRSRRVLLIASGSAPDVAEAMEAIAPWPCTIVLNDIDGDALDFATRRLEKISDRLVVVNGNVLRIFRQLAALGPFDLVVAGGLLDYLEQRAAHFLVRTVIKSLLAKGGIFFFTNIKRGNRFRPWIEYLADWRLIERSEEDLRELVGDLSFSDSSLDVSLDRSGLAYLVTLRRGSA